MVAYYCIRINPQRIHNNVGHTITELHLEREVLSACFQSDKMIPTYLLDINYVVSIPTKED